MYIVYVKVDITTLQKNYIFSSEEIYGRCDPNLASISVITATDGIYFEVT